MEKQYLDKLYREREAEAVQATPQPQPEAAEPVPLEPRRVKPAKRPSKHIMLITGGAIVALLILGGSALTYRHWNQDTVVPKNLAKQVSFPIYYPDQKKLPKGYTLNLKSFSSPQKDVILYAVDYGSNKKLVFSVQSQPSDNDIQSFYAKYIPLRNQMRTNLGEAQIGAYGSGKDLKTIVSLPTNKGAWLIVTAPYDINQNQLKQILNSLKK